LAGEVFSGAALTIVAEGLRRGDAIDSLIWMGGATRGNGNMTAAAEFNAWMDPAAADAVFVSPIPTCVVPLEITWQCVWFADDIDRLEQCGRAGALLARAARPLCARDGAWTPHDAVAAAALLQPSLFEWESRYVRCEAFGQRTTGATVVDRRRHSPTANAHVASTVAHDNVRNLIYEAVAALD
jgi:inosine-uridine nucleoside N-ribohydrolase